MIPTRVIALVFGPIVAVSVAYWIAVDHRPAEASLQTLARASQSVLSSDLPSACALSAEELRSALGPQSAVIVRPPFVLAGDVTEAQLETHYQQTIVPTARALRTSYFDIEPDAPITILMFASAESYRAHASRLDGRDVSSFQGYYERSKRRAVLNISTGDGTLAHELTHALAQFDFHDMPEWFDEGLASLHEESRFSDDGRRLVGLSNWRLYYLAQGIRRGSARPLAEFLSDGRVRPEQQALDYASARYLCLYLQEQGLLEAFYRKFRANAVSDPTGAASLCELLRVESLAEADEAFRAWALAKLPQHQAGR